MSGSIIYCIVDVFSKAESEEKVREILLKIVQHSREEDGCLKYKLFQNINDHTQFTFIEVWANEDAFEDHLQSEHIRQAGVAINEELAKPTDIKRYQCIQTVPKKTGGTNLKFCALV